MLLYPLGASLAAAVVVVGASLPWVTITGTVEPGLGRVFGVTGDGEAIRVCEESPDG